MRSAAWVFLLTILLVLAGCTTPAPVAPDASAPVRGGGASAFVALIDTGINPYHAAFRSSWGPPPVPVPFKTIPDSFRSELKDRGLEAWNDLHTGQLYWFEGTRVLAISTKEPETLPGFGAVFGDPHVIYDDENHGTATASVVARLCPDCWIVEVERARPDLPSLEWAANPDQSWIDVLSRSIGNVAHTPVVGTNDPFSAILLQAVEGGKLVVNSGGNDPSPNLLDESGAPWVISVGGARGDEHGVVPYASQPVDVVADYLVHGLARNNSDTATFTGDGTSFGAPIVAGVLGEVVYQLRNQTGYHGGMRNGALVDSPGLRVTNIDVRRALNLTARYWNTTDYAPGVDGGIVGLADTATPVPPAVPGTPVGPWLQMGWGYVDAKTAPAMVQLLLGKAPVPAKTDAAAYMAQVNAAREAVWHVRQGEP